MNRFRSLLVQSKVTISIAGLILVVLLGIVDYETGPEISFSIFYLLPISLVTWYTDLKGGIVSATMSAITWLIADLLNPTIYSHPLIPYWNAVVRLLVFLVIVYLGSALKDLNHDLEKRVKDRTALLEEEVAERKRIESRIQQYTKRLEILHDIDQAILAAESLEAITHATIGHVLNTLPCQRVSLILFDFETRDVILLDLSEKKKNEKPVETSFPMEKVSDFDDIFAILNEDSLNVKDDLSTSPLISPILQILQAQDYQSLTIVPIFVKDELIGTLNLMAFSQNAFFTEHQEVGREIANQLGIAINQAHLLSRLRTDQENLQALSQQLLDVQESERRTIARELHDEVGQALTSIGITLEMATSLLPEVRTDSLKQAHLLVVELMERVSKLSLELRPALLDDLGLLPALLWHFDRYAAQTNIQVKFKHSGLEERRFAPEIETAAYRIVQEALTNIARHAQVNEACVTIWYDLNTLGIQVEDKGKGFDASTVMARGSSGGMLGMQERAWLLNGKLTIETARGKGTRLLAELPTTELPKG